MLINEDLAQRIVDSAMLLVHRNVNIMNRDGIIIATGHPHRRHTFHKGAKDVIETGMVIEIYPDQLGSFPGALQGINLPIVFEEQVVGVIGIFGQPEEVRDTGRLVKAITELILERELLQEETRSRYRLREQFFETVLTTDITHAQPKLKRLAKSMNINLSLPRSVAVIPVSPFIRQAMSGYGSSELVVERSIEAVLKHISQSSLIDDQDLAVIWEEQLVILKAFPAPCELERLPEWGHDMLDSLAKLNSEIVCCGIGSLANSIDGYAASYRQSLHCLKHCKTSHALRTIYDRDLLVSYTLHEAAGPAFTAAIAPLSAKFGKFITKKIDGRATLQALLDANLNLSVAAQTLHIHRNTLMFRLDQCRLLTGLDPVHHFEDAALCRILLELNK